MFSRSLLAHEQFLPSILSLFLSWFFFSLSLSFSSTNSSRLSFPSTREWARRLCCLLYRLENREKYRCIVLRGIYAAKPVHMKSSGTSFLPTGKWRSVTGGRSVRLDIGVGRDASRTSPHNQYTPKKRHGQRRSLSRYLYSSVFSAKCGSLNMNFFIWLREFIYHITQIAWQRCRVMNSRVIGRYV